MEFSDSPVINEKTVKTLLKLFDPKTKEIQKGESILNEAAKENRLCLLLKGTAYLCLENEYGGRQLLDFFTERQILCQRIFPSSANGHCYVYAKYPCTVAFLDRRQLMTYMEQNPSSGLATLFFDLTHCIISARNEHCHMLQQKTIRDKLLAFLHYQSVKQQKELIHIPIPYSDLADYLAIDRSSLMTELSQMHLEGLIEKNSRDIRLLK